MASTEILRTFSALPSKIKDGDLVFFVSAKGDEELSVGEQERLDSLEEASESTSHLFRLKVKEMNQLALSVERQLRDAEIQKKQRLYIEAQQAYQDEGEPARCH